RQAAIDALPVDNDRAGATLPLIASLLRAGEREMLAQRIEQCRTRIDCQSLLATVNLKSDSYVARRGFGIGRAGSQRGLRMADEGKGGCGSPCFQQRASGNVKTRAPILILRISIHDCFSTAPSVRPNVSAQTCRSR